jgi:hypothetical protein
MDSSIIWLFARLALLALGVFSFAGFMHYDTNFDPVSGLVCVLFGFVLFTVMKKSVRREEMFSLTSAFWPPWKYVQAYWFTIGSVIFLSSAANLIFRLDDPAAISLYTGLTLLGAGLLAGAIFARYRLRKV